MLRWCWAHLYVAENIAGEGIDGALLAMPPVKQHFRALPLGEVGAALATAEGSRTSLAARLCLRFLILTAARSGEVRGTTWSEADSGAREWRIPGDRMKDGAGHRVPLSDAALAVLKRARGLDDGSGLVFPTLLRSGRSFSDMTLTRRSSGPGTSGPGDGSRVPERVSRLVRGDGEAAGDRRGGARPHRRRSRESLFPNRSARAPARAYGPVGRVPHGHWRLSDRRRFPPMRSKYSSDWPPYRFTT